MLKNHWMIVGPVVVGSIFLICRPSDSSPSPNPITQPSAAEAPAAPEKSLYDLGKAASHAGDYKGALEYFKQAYSREPTNPDVLNMLAFTQRKTGDLDHAIENYQKALRLRPRFPEAREYLGEAYVQAAAREVETLKGYGSEATEEMKDLIKEFKEEAQKLP